MKYEKVQFNCPVEATLSLIGGKYKPLILWHLIDQPLHYMELHRLIPKATPKMLSQQLHDLEDCGMIHREVIPEKGELFSGWVRCSALLLSKSEIEHERH